MIQIVHTNGDTRPTYEFRLKKGGKAVDLSGCSVEMKVQLSDTTIVTKTATITDADSGKCTVAFSATDLDVVGYAKGELKVTFADTGIQHSTYTIEMYVRDLYEVVPWH